MKCSVVKIIVYKEIAFCKQSIIGTKNSLACVQTTDKANWTNWIIIVGLQLKLSDYKQESIEMFTVEFTLNCIKSIIDTIHVIWSSPCSSLI